MNERRRPPAEITPDELFTAWLPAEVARLGSAAGIPDLLVRVELDGAGGGAWDLQFGGGKLTGGAAVPSRRALVTLRLTLQDFRALAVGEPGPISLTPPNATPLDLLFIDSSSQQLLANMTGTYAFEVTGYNGRTWRLLASFGGGPASQAPDASITTDAQTYADLLARKLSGPEAYFTGKIVIAGDAARGMQVGLALLPKF